MKKDELTYILGAGASYQSIPIVKTFSNRFNQFLGYVNGVAFGNGFEQDKQEKFKEILRHGISIKNAFESHQSFDTYFKKLFHTGQNDKISQGKKILNLYFTWEHLSLATPKPDKHDESIFWKQSVIDKRYDALIAGLLQPLADKIDPYCNVNFITWNYDLNLLISLKNYYFPNGKIRDFLKEIKKENGTWVIEDKITIINMNGYFYSSQFDDLVSLDAPNIHDVLYNKICNENYFELSQIEPLLGYSINTQDTDAELINFAWEPNNSLPLIAKTKIINSKNIVVIGYTFPLYNRLIDLEYLPQNLITTKKIFIQDPNADNVSQSLIDNYQLQNLTGLESKLISITNCDSFYVPSDIFGVAELRRGVTSYAFGT